MPIRFEKRLEHGPPVVTDGGMGVLISSAVAGLRCPEEANLRSPESVVSLHASFISAGAELIETNTFGANRHKLRSRFLEDELDYILENSSPRVALVASELRERFTGLAQRHGVERTHEITDWGIDMPPADPVHEDVAVARDEGVLLCYTSGSTSRPKPVFHSHGGLLGATSVHRTLWHVDESD